MVTRSPIPAAAPSPTDWRARLNGDPLPWLLDAEEPAVRHRALQELLDLPPSHPDVVEARATAMNADPIATILAAQDPDGWWVQPGGGYGPKYSGTVWSLMFLDQLGADGSDPRIRMACEYVLEHSQASNDGFASAGGKQNAKPSYAIHCLNGNLLRALIGFGWLDDERVQRSLDWQTASITGEGDIRWYRTSTSGPGFQCAINEHLPCGWGAAKAVLALARVPVAARSAAVTRARGRRPPGDGGCLRGGIRRRSAAGRGGGLAVLEAGRRGALPERVPLHGQDAHRHRPRPRPEPVGHVAGGAGAEDGGGGGLGRGGSSRT